MIRHGETGFLADSDEELAYYAARLAYDETLRMGMIETARKRLVGELADEEVLWNAWTRLFRAVAS